MGSKIHVYVISLVLFFFDASGAQSNTFDVRKYGARADARSDTSKALLSAWKEACAAVGSSKIMIPKGTYLLGVVDLKGPCKGAMHLEVQGTFIAPTSPNAHNKASWITFAYIDRLTISGGGTFDGRGEIAWKQNNCGQNPKCKSLPISLRFDFVTNSIVRDVTSLDSKNFHVNVMGSENVTFQHFTVIAPGHSINTDGIHIGRSKRINIIDSDIITGDDCISIGDGSQQIRITKVRCGQGHGISVGSLGKYEKEDPVVGIFVRNCTVYDTDNGVRIKTWPALHGGIASDMHFEDIIMKNVSNPILIDQVYCPWNQCNPKIPSKVKINNVSFKNIQGSSTTPIAIRLNCSSIVPCEKVELANINLKYIGADGPIKSLCANVKPRLIGQSIPPGC
ncbi:exopolygalacturonase-like [Hevea brasiliensis]|uniref:exopolygalacturonase-like n=1 Tax=Hevea brasiliensis TaxID=3981 RepID=UPI000B77910B|nr:exopolygalacturonase-like [Hevea brasiliensis]